MIAGTEEEGSETPEETAFYHRMMDESTQRLKTMKDKYAGEDCYVIGTGSSLLNTDFRLIKDKYLFGVNDLYRGFKQFNIQPQFYGISDGVFLPKYGDVALAIDSQFFLTRFVEIQYLRDYEHYSKIVKREPILLRSLLPEMVPPDQSEPYDKGSERFSKDASEGTYSGWTVIIDTALQVCYYLGFNRAILLGCDCDYTIQSHFHNPPHILKSQHEQVHIWPYCYEICKRAYEEDGREIINATVGGRLEVFKRKRLEEVVNK